MFYVKDVETVHLAALPYNLVLCSGDLLQQPAGAELLLGLGRAAAAAGPRVCGAGGRGREQPARRARGGLGRAAGHGDALLPAPAGRLAGGRQAPHLPHLPFLHREFTSLIHFVVGICWL